MALFVVGGCSPAFETQFRPHSVETPRQARVCRTAAEFGPGDVSTLIHANGRLLGTLEVAVAHGWMGEDVDVDEKAAAVAAELGATHVYRGEIVDVGGDASTWLAPMTPGATGTPVHVRRPSGRYVLVRVDGLDALPPALRCARSG